MSISYRPMLPRDVDRCIAIVAKHPVLASRYGETIRSLGPCWRRFIGSDGFLSAVFEETRNSNAEMLGAAIAVFVSDDFVCDLKCQPGWICSELTQRITRGESPVLSETQVREANSCGGLNVAVWQSGLSPENMARYEVGEALMAALTELIRGYLLKEIVTQAEAREQAHGIRHTGSLLWNNIKGSYQEFVDVDPAELLSQQHLVGITRKLAYERVGSWIGSHFSYQPPKLALRRSAQRLLLAALDNANDQVLSDRLGISLFTVKKTWRSIYECVALQLPELVPSPRPSANGPSGRGKEKKQRLIAYLRDHPEELRPVSWKLLTHTAHRPQRPPDSLPRGEV